MSIGAQKELVAIFGSDRVSSRRPDQLAYSRDMWPRLLLATRDGSRCEFPPSFVVWPASEAELVRLVGYASEHRIPLVPYGGGSGVCGGVVPIHGGISVDMKLLNQLLAVEGSELTCEAQAGINGERLERELNRRGFTLGHFPSSMYCSTLGGWLAARSAGQLSTRYGKIEDMVLDLTLVTGRGDLLTTSRLQRAHAGPDWTQLIVGSEGTLGFVTRARMRIQPMPELRVLRAFEFESVLGGLEAIRRIMQMGLRPAVVRLYDEFDTLIARRRDTRSPAKVTENSNHPSRGPLPDFGKPHQERGSFLDQVRHLLPEFFDGRIGAEIGRALLERPGRVNRLAEWFAQKVQRTGCLLILGNEGARRRTEIEARLIRREMISAGGEDLGEGPAQHWFENRYRVSYGMSKVYDAGLFVDTMEVASTWERILSVYERVRQALSKHAFVMAHFSHAYPEGCSIYFTVVGFAKTRHAAESKYDAIWRDGAGAAIRAGGTFSHHHGVGLLKANFMREEYRESFAIYEALKKTFDPRHILNPGKMGLKIPEGIRWANLD